MLKVPVKLWVTLPDAVVAAPLLVADRFSNAENGVAFPASIWVTVIGTLTAVIVVLPVPLFVPVIVLAVPTCPNVKIVVALAVAANSTTTVLSRSNRFVMAILRLAW